MCISDLIIRIACKQLVKQDGRRMAKQKSCAGVDVVEFDYAGDGDAMHKLNFYRPQGNDAILPLIIDVHGGAWVYGDKELNKNYCMYLASKGYAVVGMSYRLMPHTDLRGQIGDVAAAISFVADRAEKLKFDPDKVMLTGDSAGGHLSSLLCCIYKSPALAELYGVKVPKLGIRCLVLSHAVCDVHELALNGNGKVNKLYFTLQRKFERMMFGRRPKKSPYYGKSSFVEVANGVDLPPIMIIGCEKDQFLQHTYRLDAFMKKRGGEYLFDFVSAKDGARLGHVYNILRPEWQQSVRVNDLSLRFFDRCCKNADQ